MITKYNGPGFQIDHEAGTLKEAFAFLGQCDDMFGPAECCENCKGTDIRPHIRHYDKGDYYELLCKTCGWAFQIGQNKDGVHLFPKGWQAPYNGQQSTPVGRPAPEAAPF